VSYGAKRLNKRRPPGRAARASQSGAVRRFGAASLSIVGAPQVTGGDNGGHDCSIALTNNTQYLFQESGESNWPSDTWDPGIPQGAYMDADDSLAWESDGGLFRGCQNSATWKIVPDPSDPTPPAATFTVTTTYPWTDPWSNTCTSSNPQFSCQELRFSIVAVAAVLLVVPGAAKAQSPSPLTLDQSQSLFVTWLGVTGPEAMMAQTFRAGLSGGLSQVELAVNTGEVQPDGPLVVELQSTSGGEPSGQVLATASVPAQPCCTSLAWVPFQLQPVVPITAGTLYALTLRAPGFSGVPTYGWWFYPSSGPAGDVYPAGDRWFLDAPGQWIEGTGDLAGDFAFKTYVNQAGVGAPGALPDLAQRIAELKALLERLGLPPGLTDRLQRLLDRVLAALPPGNTARASRSLRAFGNRVAAQRGKKLTVAQARRLSTAARALRASLALRRLER
jgi:hypothetical protein